MNLVMSIGGSFPGINKQINPRLDHFTCGILGKFCGRQDVEKNVVDGNVTVMHIGHALTCSMQKSPDGFENAGVSWKYGTTA